MNLNLIFGILIGFLICMGFVMLILWEDYKDHGGSILIDFESGVYRILLNNDPEDWGDKDFVILRVSKSEQRLKRLKDINPLELEDRDEDQ